MSDFRFKVGDRVVRVLDIRDPGGPVMRGTVVRCYSTPRQVNPGNSNIVYQPCPEVYSITFDAPHGRVTRDGYGRYGMQLESEYDGVEV